MTRRLKVNKELHVSDIITRINNLHEYQAPLWGVLTANEMLVHCTDYIRLALGELYVRRKGNFYSKTVRRFIFMHLPLSKNVSTFKEINPRTKGGRPVDFEDDKKTLLEKLDKFINCPASLHFPDHALFGKFSKADWRHLIIKHLDHHLKQFGC